MRNAPTRRRNIAADEQELADQLNAHWDQVVRGEPPDCAELEPGLVATLEELQVLDGVPLPAAAFLRQLEGTLLEASPPAQAQQAPLAHLRIPLPRRPSRWLLGAAAVVLALILSAGAARALVPPTAPLDVQVVPKERIIYGPEPADPTPLPPGVAPPVHVVGTPGTPPPRIPMSLNDAQRAAGFHVLRSVGDPKAHLLSVDYSPPATPKPAMPHVLGGVHLIYQFGKLKLSILELSNPTPGQPLQFIQLGIDPPMRVEQHDDGPYVVTRTPNGQRVETVYFATDTTFAIIHFASPYADWPTVADFLAHLQ